MKLALQATQLELSTNQWQGLDFYDISLVVSCTGYTPHLVYIDTCNTVTDAVAQCVKPLLMFTFKCRCFGLHSTGESVSLTCNIACAFAYVDCHSLTLANLSRQQTKSSIALRLTFAG